MKTTIVFFTLLFGKITFAQSSINEDYIQNFYTIYKTEKFFAFQQVNTGIELLNSLQYSRSINKFNKALEIDSNYCDALFLLGFCYQRKGQLDKSLDFCEKALKINSNNPSALIIKGTTLLMKNDTVNALESFQKAKNILPNKIDSYYGIAMVYYIEKKYDDAYSLIKEIEKIKNDDVIRRDKKKVEKLKLNIIAKK